MDNPIIGLMNVKPAQPGTVVRDPATLERLPDEGAEVPDTAYWRRRLQQGDVVETAPQE